MQDISYFKCLKVLFGRFSALHNTCNQILCRERKCVKKRLSTSSSEQFSLGSCTWLIGGLANRRTPRQLPIHCLLRMWHLQLITSTYNLQLLAINRLPCLELNRSVVKLYY